jgi:hypothetical protein
MERVSKSWEDAQLRVNRGAPTCARAAECKGVTARTVHGAGFGRALEAFSLPSGRAFGECLLCLRAGASARWYEALFTRAAPAEPVHAWCVRVGRAGEYDEAQCLGPCDEDAEAESAYVGAQGPFPRYDETTLLVREWGFEQVYVHSARVPRLTGPSRRVGARPLGWHEAYRTQWALVLGGYVCEESRAREVALAALYARCSPSAKCPTGEAAWFHALVGRGLQGWLRGVQRLSWAGEYPHAAHRCDSAPGEMDAFQQTMCVREHVTFLVERDSRELGAAVRRVWPDWDEYVREVRLGCDAMRASGWALRKVKIKTRARAAPGPARSLFEYRELRVNVSAEDMEWYVCTSCGKFKSDTKRGGCLDVCIDLETGSVHCFKKRAVGRKPMQLAVERAELDSLERAGCFGLVRAISFGRRLVLVNGVGYGVCSRCESDRVCLNWSSLMGTWSCAACASASAEAARSCEMCGSKCGKQEFKIRAFEKESGARDVWFCKAHARHRLRAHAEVWSYDLLMEAASEVKSAKRGRR